MTYPARSAATAFADRGTRPEALADRAVTSWPETSTIRARPAASTCVSPFTGLPPSGHPRSGSSGWTA